MVSAVRTKGILVTRCANVTIPFAKYYGRKLKTIGSGDS